MAKLSRNEGTMKTRESAVAAIEQERKSARKQFDVAKRVNAYGRMAELSGFIDGLDQASAIITIGCVNCNQKG